MREFDRVLTAAALMSDLQAEWFVVGGWAIDLFLGERTRDHDDVDIGLAREDQAWARRFLPGWTHEKVLPRGAELVREPWAEGEWLDLPIHEVHACSPAGDRLELLFLERRAAEWVYRRDSRVTLAWHRLGIASPLGLKSLAPEVVLLFKSKAPRDRDQLDFEAALPRLERERRAWLRAALELAHPRHRWLNDLV